MYLPEHFSENEQTQIVELIQKYSFATILSFTKGERPFVNHLPVIFSEGDNKILIGHMARRNPQWSHFLADPNCTLIFNGPNTYITPRWYRSGVDVPTWNYAVVHLHGKIEIVEDFEGQIEILKQLVKYFESGEKAPWNFELPDDLLNESALTSAIVSFRFHIEKVEAKFKLSQNRSEADRKGVLVGLGQRTDEMSKAIMKMMAE